MSLELLLNAAEFIEQQEKCAGIEKMTLLVGSKKEKVIDSPTEVSRNGTNLGLSSIRKSSCILPKSSALDRNVLSVTVPSLDESYSKPLLIPSASEHPQLSLHHPLLIATHPTPVQMTLGRPSSIPSAVPSKNQSFTPSTQNSSPSKEVDQITSNGFIGMLDIDKSARKISKEAESVHYKEENRKRVIPSREVHNKLEKNRRAHLKECFEILRRQLPCLEDKKISNQTILKAAYRHINTLKRKEKEYEHEMERLARQKITYQQKLTILKKELQSKWDHIDFSTFLPELSSYDEDCKDKDTNSTSTASEQPDIVDEKFDASRFISDHKEDGPRFFRSDSVAENASNFYSNEDNLRIDANEPLNLSKDGTEYASTNSSRNVTPTQFASPRKKEALIHTDLSPSKLCPLSISSPNQTQFFISQPVRPHSEAWYLQPKSNNYGVLSCSPSILDNKGLHLLKAPTGISHLPLKRIVTTLSPSTDPLTSLENPHTYPTRLPPVMSNCLQNIQNSSTNSNIAAHSPANFNGKSVVNNTNIHPLSSSSKELLSSSKFSGSAVQIHPPLHSHKLNLNTISSERIPTQPQQQSIRVIAPQDFRFMSQSEQSQNGIESLSITYSQSGSCDRLLASDDVRNGSPFVMKLNKNSASSLHLSVPVVSNEALQSSSDVPSRLVGPFVVSQSQSSVIATPDKKEVMDGGGGGGGGGGSFSLVNADSKIPTLPFHLTASNGNLLNSVVVMTSV